MSEALRKERTPPSGSRQNSTSASRKPETETITIIVPRQFVAAAKEMARILGYSEDDLGKVIAEYGWTIPDALGDLHSDMEYRTWRDEQECRQVAGRIAERRLKGEPVPTVCRVGKKWMIRFVGNKIAAAA